MDDDPSFGNWVAARRRALGLSRPELARRVGCATVTLRKIEADERRPSPDFAARMAEYLAVPSGLNELFVRVARGQVGVHRLPSPAALPDLLPPEDMQIWALPAMPTPIIGREHDTAAVEQLLLREDVRLVTLIGAPGIGKTRLAQEVAARVQVRFAAGACLVSLTSLENPRQVAEAIVAGLRIPAGGSQPPQAQLHQYLRDKSLLLVLTGFEQVLDAAPLVGELLAACPALRILATSRERLHLRAEQRYRVQPLDMDAAIEFFFRCARAAEPSFQLTPANRPMVAEICRCLDCLPLAIELTAARSDLATLELLLARLKVQLLDVAADGPRDLPSRHRTLREAIDRSYLLLTPPEQLLFGALSVFAGGFTAEAAEAVADAQVPALELFVHKNLLSTQPRFMMLETIRERAAEWLVCQGRSDEVQRRHLTYYVALAEAAEPALNSADPQAWLTRLEQEIHNFRAALSWSLRAGEPVSAARLSTALQRFWLRCGHPEEGRRWLALTRAAGSSAALPVALQIRLLNSEGSIAVSQADYPAAQQLFADALALAEHSDDQQGIAFALDGLAALQRVSPFPGASLATSST